MAQVVQQSRRRRGLTGFMIVVCLEPEAVGNGTMSGGALVVHRAMRGAVVETKSGDVEVEGGVGPGVYDGTGR